MSKVAIGSIINGWKIIKRIFKSILPGKSLYKVKCLLCGNTYKKRLDDIKKETCNCKNPEFKKEEKLIQKTNTKVKPVFSKKNLEKSIGEKRGKYTVVGYFLDPFVSDSPSMKRKTSRFIVQCSLCGELCVMSNNNLNRSKEKRDKNVTCNHKIFFNHEEFKNYRYYIDEKFIK